MVKPVMVGFDGSAHSQVAVDWAAGDALLRHRPLLVVHSFSVLDQMAVTDEDREAAVHNMVKNLVDAELERVRERVPGIEVNAHIVGGLTPGTDLVNVSRDGEVMVVGSRGRGVFSELLLGSTATQVAAHSLCPVVVVRGNVTSDTAGPDRVVVGVDGSPLSQAALRFGFDEASMRGARLVAVHVWKYPVSTGPGDMLPLVYDLDVLSEDEERLLAEALAGWRSKYPDVVVEPVNIRGDVRKVLKEQSVGARLLVLGSRGHGGFTGLLLGSVAQAMTHHAEAPVAIIHAT